MIIDFEIKIYYIIKLIQKRVSQITLIQNIIQKTIANKIIKIMRLELISDRKYIQHQALKILIIVRKIFGNILGHNFQKQLIQIKK